MERLIKKEIRQPISEELLFGKLTEGGSVSLRVEKERLKVVCRKKGASRKTAKKEQPPPVPEESIAE